MSDPRMVPADEGKLLAKLRKAAEAVVDTKRVHVEARLKREGGIDLVIAIMHHDLVENPCEMALRATDVEDFDHGRLTDVVIGALMETEMLYLLSDELLLNHARRKALIESQATSNEVTS